MSDGKRESGLRTPRAEPAATTEELDRLFDDPPGFVGLLKAIQNDTIGRRLILTGLFFVILGGTVDSLVMRLQLARPEQELVPPELYNQLFTNHGSVTMFLVILPIFEGFAIMLLPFMLGAREMPFPRLGAFAYFTFLFGGLVYYSSTLFGLVPDAGWFAYTPLSGPEFSPGLPIDFWVLGLGVAEVGAIAAAVEIIISVLKMRAPGMTLTRIPIFAWAMLVTAVMILFAFTPLIVGSLMLELDRGFGTRFFDPEQGGSSLLWQHLFWIFGHPEVYIQFLPAAGIVSMILPVMVRRRLVGYPWLVAAFVAIGFLSFGLWAHHMFAVGLPSLVLTFFAAASMAIAIPAGVQVFAWLATLFGGRPVWSTAFLFVVGFLIVFTIGGVTGVMVASVPFDLQAHDSYFVVAHLHYVLIGGVAFPIFAGIYYWFPKVTGRMLSERLGKWHFWLVFTGVNVAFFPMHIVGLLGMPRRVYTYSAGEGWDTYNLVSTIGVFVIAAGMLVFVANLVLSRLRGEEAGDNPWGADSLEWAVSSPPKQHGWSVHPVVRSPHPLWDQDDLRAEDPKLQAFLESFARWPLRWRAALVVHANDARPEEIFRVASPSIWPLVAALGTVTIFIAELVKLRWGALVGLLVVIGAAIAWNWPQPAPMSEEEEERFEREHGVPVRAGGSAVISRWGMQIAILFVSIAFSSFLLGYFYLRLANDAWPPPAIPRPDPWPATIVATALVLTAAGAAWVAVRLAARGDRRGVTAAMGAAAAAGTLGVVVQAAHVVGLPFDAQVHAYGSIFHTLSWFVLAVAGAGVLMAGSVVFWSLRGAFTARRHVHVLNAGRYWGAVAAIWLIGVGTLVLGPYLT